jgi:uncharacterized membrane protein YfhO
MLAKADFDPEGEVIIEADAALPACTAVAGVAEISGETANSVQVTAGQGGGWLVLADAWFPGWHAYANGEELTIYPAYGLFRAVQLPENASTVEFIYRPLSFTLGLWLTLLAWPAWLLFWSRTRP